MFTGLIEAVAEIDNISVKGGGIEIQIDVSGLKCLPEVGASIAVNGVCLTVTKLHGAKASFDAVTETVKRSTLKGFARGDTVNLETAVKAGDHLDGHIVQGHVDSIAELLEIKELAESRVYFFSLDAETAPLVAEKGSIAVDGVSLTVAGVFENRFSVSLIPETLKRTSLGGLRVKSAVNIEVDVISRYIARQLKFKSADNSKSSLTMEKLAENGFL
ncbi:MAG: riboflavin synthase [Planctomycetota bacterium]|jgi:riboflavin synthase